MKREREAFARDDKKKPLSLVFNGLCQKTDWTDNEIETARTFLDDFNQVFDKDVKPKGAPLDHAANLARLGHDLEEVRKAHLGALKNNRDNQSGDWSHLNTTKNIYRLDPVGPTGLTFDDYAQIHDNDIEKRHKQKLSEKEEIIRMNELERDAIELHEERKMEELREKKWFFQASRQEKAQRCLSDFMDPDMVNALDTEELGPRLAKMVLTCDATFELNIGSKSLMDKMVLEKEEKEKSDRQELAMVKREKLAKTNRSKILANLKSD